MASTSRGSIPNIMERRWARPSRSACTNRSRGCGKTPWAAAGPSGRTGFPMAQRIFREALAGVKFEPFHAAVNHVAPSLIRVQADEATYNLHIIVRFELERALIAGDLAVADLPAAWNDKYRDPGRHAPQRRRRAACKTSTGAPA